MASPFIHNLGYAVLTVFLSFVVLALVVRHPAIEHRSDFIELPDGRHLSYLIRGNPKRQNAILWSHGMLSSRYESIPISEELLEELDAYIVTPDRSGYGESSVEVGRSFDSSTEDIMTLADTLDISKFFLVGVSGGGPHAFDVAVKHPDRVRGILALSAACDQGIFHASRLQGSDAKPDPKIFAIYRYLRDHSWARTLLQSSSELYVVGRALHSLFLEKVSQQALAGFAEADRRCAVITLKGSYLVKVVPEALRQGTATPVIQDILSVMMPPTVGFNNIPEKLQAATHIWHSDHDPQVNPVCQEEYVRQLPRAKSKTIKGGGHFAYWSCQKDLQREALEGLIASGLPK